MPEQATGAAAPVLPRLTALRWYAALAVLLYHLGNQVRWAPASLFQLGGQAGVSFFFVLSGFVLTWSYRPEGFYRRRLARICPAALATTLVAAALQAAGHTWVRGTGGDLVASVLLMHAWIPGTGSPVHSYNTVTWSLSCELFFYACLPALLDRFRGWGNRTVVAFTAAAVGVAVLVSGLLAGSGPWGAAVAYYNPLVRVPEFAVGVAMAVLAQRGWRPRLRLLPAAALLVGVMVGARALHRYPLEDYLLLPGSVAVVAAGFAADLRGTVSWLTGRRSRYLGELSFCFYLVHWLVLTALISHFGWMGPHQIRALPFAAGLPLLLACLIPSLAAAAVLHHGVERPMRALLAPRRPDVRAVPVRSS